MKLFRSVLAFVFLSLIACIRAESLSTGEDVDAFLDQYIAEHDIMVFAKSTCKYCKNTKKVLDKMHKKTGLKGWTARFLYLDYMSSDGPMLHKALIKKTGQDTVPCVFIGGKHVGGNTEVTTMYKSGELLKAVDKISGAKSRV